MESNLVIEKMDANLLKVLRKFQANELLGYEVYKRLSKDKRLSPENAETLSKIA